MKKSILLLIIILGLTAFTTDSFKTQQKKYPRVRQAYSDKEGSVKNLCKEKSLDIGKIQVYLRAFKQEKKIELWAKNKSDQKYQLVKEYKICSTSGKLGPKRKQGDLQIPEGFYHIDRFNPHSVFYLSLGINYPRFLHSGDF